MNYKAMGDGPVWIERVADLIQRADFRVDYEAFLRNYGK